MSRYLRLTGRRSMICVAASAFAAAVIWSAKTQGEEKYPNIQSCGLDYWSNARNAADIAMGVPLGNIAGQNREVVADLIKTKGITYTLMTVQAIYFKCVRDLKLDLKAMRSSVNEAYFQCAEASAFRFLALTKFEEGNTKEQSKIKLHAQLHPTIEAIYKVIGDQGFESTVNLAATSAKECVARARQASR